MTVKQKTLSPAEEITLANRRRDMVYGGVMGGVIVTTLFFFSQAAGLDTVSAFSGALGISLAFLFELSPRTRRTKKGRASDRYMVISIIIFSAVIISGSMFDVLKAISSLNG